MRRSILPVLLLLCCCTGRLCAQTFFSSAEYGITIGGAQYFGDLNEQYGFKYVRPAAGAFMRYQLNPYVAIRGTALLTRVGYDDAFSNNPYQQQRNLSFRSDVAEIAVQTELNFTRFSTGDPDHRFTPYLTAGVGAFYYNPYTTFNGRRQYLQPLGTEGQNFNGYENRRYHKIAASFPVGAGFKYWVRPGLNLGFEIVDHLTTTDYLDDVSTTYVGADQFFNDPRTPNPAFYLQDPSMPLDGTKLGRAGKQRGNSSSKDQFLTFVFNISFQLKVYRCPTYLQRDILE